MFVEYHSGKCSSAQLKDCYSVLTVFQLLYSGRVRLGSIRNKNSWNNASKRSFGSYSHSGILGFHSRYSAPKNRIARVYSKNTFLFRIDSKRTRPRYTEAET